MSLFICFFVSMIEKDITHRLIDTVNYPEDLKDFSISQLKILCKELREELINKISLCGGHFASSLGITEVTVALHYFFNTPSDKLIWDVGHQAYIHKMLTGRKNDISHIRKKNHISGYLKRSESIFDAFGGGHAGNSISSAVGIATALREEKKGNSVIAIIGDASISSGMCFEALNHAGELHLNNLIVILNDNQMAISPNVGAIKWLLNKGSFSKFPTKVREKIKKLYQKGYIPSFLYKIIDRIEEACKGIISTPSVLFESFGFKYIGPVDGHNIEQLLTAFKIAKMQDTPVLLHVKTIKGKGFKSAENNPTAWHACIPFFPVNGKARSIKEKKFPIYTEVFSNTVEKLITNDKNIVTITAAMATGTGLDKIQKDFPQNFFDVGIAESHAVTFAGGLATEGKKPIVAIYSTFLQRGFDQILHDIALQNLHVIFAIDRAGCVGADGETHQGAFDISYLRFIPNMVLMAPKDENELQHMLYTATKIKKPVAIRYPRGEGIGVCLDRELKEIPFGKAQIVQCGSKILIISYGTAYKLAKEACERIFEETTIYPTIINARFAKPLDSELLLKEIKRHEIVCTIEDQTISGGFGSAVLELASDNNLDISIKRFGINDIFVPHGTQQEQYELCNFSSECIYNYLKDNISKIILKKVI